MDELVTLSGRDQLGNTEGLLRDREHVKETFGIADVPEALTERRPRRVPGAGLQNQLARPGFERQVMGPLHQRPADALPPRGGHNKQVGQQPCRPHLGGGEKRIQLQKADAGLPAPASIQGKKDDGISVR